ncbi:MAG: ribonucleotide-diphosphate reductase subunit alpha, partial [Acidobacteriota bacterium]
TGTISLIAGCSGGIEPPFALACRRRHVLDGSELSEFHPLLLQDLEDFHLNRPDIRAGVERTGSLAGAGDVPAELKRVYATAIEIAPERHVQMQAVFQRNCDSAVSKTVNLASASSPGDVTSVFKLAYELGCKGITVYRDRCRPAQVLNAGCSACA